MSIKWAIAEVINGRDLTLEQAEAAMDSIMDGEATPAQIGSFLTALRMKGETVDEIAGCAKSMRQHVVSVPVNSGMTDGLLVDTCGTGGDGKQTFNISTTAAFVVAGHGVTVAKHGNRAASSKSGSADVLMALGGNLDLTPAEVAECIDEIGIGFLYAINHHPAMRYAIGPRREIGQRTIFNVLGPLTNPAGATHQLIGVYDPELTEPMARVLGTLGSKAALVVHGADGLDELSTSGINRVSHLQNGQVTTYTLDPAEFGFQKASISDMTGGSPAENAQIMHDILSGKDRGPQRDIVLLNSAAVLSLAGDDLQTCLVAARESIDSGAAVDTLDRWITNEYVFIMSVSNMAKRRGKMLDEIMAYHRQQLPKIKREIPLEDLRAFAGVAPTPLDFFGALNVPGVTLIAECKKASPSKGLMVPDYDPILLASTYARAGAGAISVLTDARHFQGSLADLRDVKDATKGLKSGPHDSRGIPVLRKDFIFDPYQVYEARVAGADALLLIAAVLADGDIAELLDVTRQLGMEALVEVHTEAELKRVLPLGARVVGVNNRNLQTFEVDFDNTARLRRMIPDDVMAVGESGLKTVEDVKQMRDIGVNAVLVGETLVRSRDVFNTARSFVIAGRP